MQQQENSFNGPYLPDMNPGLPRDRWDTGKSEASQFSNTSLDLTLLQKTLRLTPEGRDIITDCVKSPAVATVHSQQNIQ